MRKKPVSAAGVIGTVADLARFEAVGFRRIGLGLAFDRLWRDIGCQAAVRVLAPESEHDFEMERVVFWAVLRRISRSGRYAAPALDDREEVPGLRDADRRYLRQAIEWLGAPLGETAPAEGMPAPRAVKDRIEEELFAGRRRRGAAGDRAFFLPLGLDFYEAWGDGPPAPPDGARAAQSFPARIALGIAFDAGGIPFACEMWPGIPSNAAALRSVAARLRGKFGIVQPCLLAGAPFLKARVIAALAQLGWAYALGTRFRNAPGIPEEVLTDGMPFVPVDEPETPGSKLDSLTAKAVAVPQPAERAGHRYVLFRSELAARRDGWARGRLLRDGSDRLESQSDEELPRLPRLRHFLIAGEGGARVRLDPEKVRADERRDGLSVVRTNTDLAPGALALRFRKVAAETREALAMFRLAKEEIEESVALPGVAAVRGQAFCSLMALLLRREMLRRLRAAGLEVEWDRVLSVLANLGEMVLSDGRQSVVIGASPDGLAGQICRALGLRTPLRSGRGPE